MAEKGVVTAVLNGGALAEIEIVRSSACSKCGACMMADGGKMRVTVKNGIGAKAGDQVNIETVGGVTFFAAFLSYGVMLIALLAGLAGGYFLASSIEAIKAYAELGGVFGAILCAVSAAILVKKFDKFFQKESVMPRIVSIAGSDDTKTGV